ncbi:Ca(2+):cation antiporter (CaCA) family protein [Abortiporus biennis]
MGQSLLRVFFLVAFVVNCILWSQSRYGHISASHSLAPRRGGLVTRSLFGIESSDHDSLLLGPKDECRPTNIPVEEQCSLVQESCPASNTFLSIPYTHRYFCAKPSARPALFAAYLVWLLFLFSTLGISASDFFCPNLSTLSYILGLDENVAGVTFLAFGNGSPDVFSTFSAMRTNSGGLAIGELLGAACFVITCVVGSMCIIKPFKVERGPFLRDVGFFTIAVIVILFVLWDSKLELWEAISLVGMYVVYVIVVVVGSWWDRRREKQRQLDALMRDEYREEVAPYHDEIPYSEQAPPELSRSSSSYLGVPSPTRARALSQPGPPRLGLEMPPRPHTRSPSPQSMHSRMTHVPRTPSHVNHMPSFSLVGALEFRRVVTSLQQQASASTLSQFSSPVSPYTTGGGHFHYHTLPRSRTSPHTPLVSLNEDNNPWDASLGLPLHDRSPPARLPPPLIEDQTQTNEDHEHLGVGAAGIPTISISENSPTLPSEFGSEADYIPPPTKRQRAFNLIYRIFHILFPTLHEFSSKSLLGKLAAIFAAPAVLVLTLTLPVIVTDYTSRGDAEEKFFISDVGEDGDSGGRLIDFEEEGVERTLVAEEEVEEELHELKFNKWLTAVQCILGPLFCVAVLFDGASHEPWLLLAAGIAGAAFAIMVAVFAKHGDSSAARLTRCTMGFIVAIVWIMAIADEVVEVLQAFGLIFGLSDAIIGITIFAMGNSLADLVANMSVAVFAPIMGFSACFGGPMLNILLGIGISGTYIIRQTGIPYELNFETTLIITGTGLLAFLLITLVYIPWNGYFLPRQWGVALIVAYTGLMVANIVVEIKTEICWSELTCTV